MAFFISCGASSTEPPLIPPPTDPLSRDFIGFGVVSVSYTHVVNEPGPGGLSLGYLRKGSLVRIVERRPVNSGGNVESWILVEGAYGGWLKEAMVNSFDNEAKARTAAESMSQ